MSEATKEDADVEHPEYLKFIIKGQGVCTLDFL